MACRAIMDFSKAGRTSQNFTITLSDEESDGEEPTCKNYQDLAVYKYTDYPEKCFSIMESYWVQEKLCDVAIMLEDDIQPVRAHRVVLAAASPYFRAMFTSNFEDASKERIQIKGVTKLIFLRLLKFAYTGSVNLLNDESVWDLLAAANMLQIREIVDAGTRFLATQLDACNTIGIQQFAEQHGLKKLKNICQDYIVNNFAEVCQSEEFLELKLCQMLLILKQCIHRIKDDCLLLEASIRWVRHNVAERSTYMRTILQVLRLVFSSVEYLENVIKTCPLIRNKPECSALLMGIVQDLNQKKLFYRVTPSNSTQCPSVLYVVGGYYGTPLGNCEIFNAFDGSWTTAPSLPVARSGLASVVVDRKLYVMGGRIHQRSNEVAPVVDTNIVNILDLDSAKWMDGPSLRFPRNRLSAVALGGIIYAIGGSCQTTTMNNVESFDPARNAWTFRASLNVARSGHGCVTINGRIYVIGGCDGTLKLDSVEVYDPALDKWTLVKPLAEPRSGLGAACLGDHIYVIGGCDSNGQTSKVHRYDPRRDEWESVARLSEARSGLSVVVMADKVYAIGGFNGSDFLSSMEVYNSVTNEWCSAPALPSPRSGHSSTAPF